MSERALDDNVLIGRAQKGDRTAFDELIRKHEARAYQYAYRLTRSQEEASDVVADAFVRVFNALPNFKGQSAFSTWLYRILTNCFLDIKKRDKTKAMVSLDVQAHTGDQEVGKEAESPGRNPGEESEKSARMRVMEAAISQLPEYQRSMIIMYHSDQLSYEEIADITDLPIGTVKSRLNRARLSLRELLSKDEELFKLG